MCGGVQALTPCLTSTMSARAKLAAERTAWRMPSRLRAANVLRPPTSRRACRRRTLPGARPRPAAGRPCPRPGGARSRSRAGASARGAAIRIRPQGAAAHAPAQRAAGGWRGGLRTCAQSWTARPRCSSSSGSVRGPWSAATCCLEQEVGGLKMTACIATSRPGERQVLRCVHPLHANGCAAGPRWALRRF